MYRIIACWLPAMLLLVPTAVADEFRAEKLDEPPPKDQLAEEIAEKLSPTGVRVIRGDSRAVCDIWLIQPWELTSLDTGLDINYPFREGQLVGVIRYPRRASDFRDQVISSGVYTLRFSLQPIDGAHVGTSPTRDFLLLVKAEDDQSADEMDYDTLVWESSEAVGTAHPGMLSLQRVRDEDAEVPSVRTDEMHDWHIVRLAGEAVVADETQTLLLDLVVVGVAVE